MTTAGAGASILGMSEDVEREPGFRGLSAERTKAFVDAVVAIAMTLLVLPLMESVGDSAARDHPTPCIGTLVVTSAMLLASRIYRGKVALTDPDRYLVLSIDRSLHACLGRIR